MMKSGRISTLSQKSLKDYSNRSTRGARKQKKVTVKQETEEWEATFNALTNFLSIQDKDFTIVKVNKACADLLKMKPEEIIGRHCYELFHGKDEPIHSCPHKRTLRTKKSVTEEFFEPLLGRYFEVSTSPIFDKNDELYGSVHIATDITERKRAEDMLKKSEAELISQKEALQKKNIALREILEQLEIEKKYIRDNVIANAENILLPIVQKLRMTGSSRKYVNLLKANLHELADSFGRRMTKRSLKFTPREIEICNMIKNGFTSKEIASLLKLSPSTIERHRFNIRKKLGIVKKDLQLSTYLQTL